MNKEKNSKEVKAVATTATCVKLTLSMFHGKQQPVSGICPAVIAGGQVSEVPMNRVGEAAHVHGAGEAHLVHKKPGNLVRR